VKVNQKAGEAVENLKRHLLAQFGVATFPLVEFSKDNLRRFLQRTVDPENHVPHYGSYCLCSYLNIMRYCKCLPETNHVKQSNNNKYKMQRSTIKIQSKS